MKCWCSGCNDYAVHKVKLADIKDTCPITGNTLRWVKVSCQKCGSHAWQRKGVKDAKTKSG